MCARKDLWIFVLRAHPNMMHLERAIEPPKKPRVKDRNLSLLE
jgi:hypothetical protein